MAPKTVYSWVEGLRSWRKSNTPEPLAEDNEQMSIVSDNEATMGRDWETAKAKAILEGKFLSFDGSATLANVEDKYLWRSMSPDTEPVSDAARISRLPAARYEPEMTPERLQPTRRNISRLGRELREVTPAPQRPERTDTMRLRPLHTSRDNISTRSWISGGGDQYQSASGENGPARAASEPGTPSRTWKSSSRGASLQPSDVPYRISWLYPTFFGHSDDPSEIASAPAISRLFTGLHEDKVDHLAGIRVDFVRETSNIQTPPESHVAAHRRTETLTPEDSISSVDSAEYMDLPICIPPDIHRPRQPTHGADESISYCPSQSTHFFYELPAAVVTLKRISIPQKRISIPPPVPARSERRLKQSSSADPISPTSGPAPTYHSGPAPTFHSRPTTHASKPPPPFYEPGLEVVRAVSVHRLPPAYKPEPRNGMMAWLQAIAGFLVVFNCSGIINAFGLFQSYYESVYLVGVSPAAISWIGSTQLCLCFVLGVPLSRLVDKGYFKLTFIVGTVVMLAGIFATSWCTTFWTIWLCQGLVAGLGIGVVFTSGTAALTTWFNKEQISTVMAVGAVGSSVGGIVYVLVVRLLLDISGFASTMRIVGGIAAATMSLPLLVLRVRGQRHKSTKKGRRTGGCLQPTTSSTTTRSLFEPAYLLAAIGLFFAFLGVYFGFVYIISYGTTVLGLSSAKSTNLLVSMLAANLPGRILSALISEKCIGPLNSLVPVAFLSTAILGLWLAGTPTYTSLVVLACFYGFMSAGIQVLYTSAAYSFCVELEVRPGTPSSLDNTEGICNEKRKKFMTNRIGLKAGGMFTFIGLAALVGTPIAGALISYAKERGLEQPFLYAQAFAGGSLLTGAILLLVSRVMKVGWTATKA